MSSAPVIPQRREAPANILALDGPELAGKPVLIDGQVVEWL